MWTIWKKKTNVWTTWKNKNKKKLKSIQTVSHDVRLMFDWGWDYVLVFSLTMENWKTHYENSRWMEYLMHCKNRISFLNFNDCSLKPYFRPNFSCPNIYFIVMTVSRTSALNEMFSFILLKRTLSVEELFSRLWLLRRLLRTHKLEVNSRKCPKCESELKIDSHMFWCD